MENRPQHCMFVSLKILGLVWVPSSRRLCIDKSKKKKKCFLWGGTLEAEDTKSEYNSHLENICDEDYNFFDKFINYLNK